MFSSGTKARQFRTQGSNPRRKAEEKKSKQKAQKPPTGDYLTSINNPDFQLLTKGKTIN